MGALFPNFDLNPQSLSPIPKNLPKPTSIFCYTNSISCSKRNIIHKCKVSIPQDLSRTKTNTVVKDGNCSGLNQDLIRRIGSGVLGFAAAVSICCDSSALAESLTVAFPVSRAHEVIRFYCVINYSLGECIFW